jgi:hypothetical protein
VVDALYSTPSCSAPTVIPLLYVGIITGGDIPTSWPVHKCIHYLQSFLRSPFHHHGTFIDLSILSSTLHVSRSVSALARTSRHFWPRHEILHARSPLFLVSRSSRPCIAVLLLELAEDSDSTGEATDERRGHRRSSPAQEKRRSGNTARAAGGARTTRPRRLPEARGTVVRSTYSTKHFAPARTHLQCHGTTPSATPCRQINHAALPPPWPPLPSPGDHHHHHHPLSP